MGSDEASRLFGVWLKVQFLASPTPNQPPAQASLHGCGRRGFFATRMTRLLLPTVSQFLLRQMRGWLVCWARSFLRPCATFMLGAVPGSGQTGRGPSTGRGRHSSRCCAARRAYAEGVLAGATSPYVRGHASPRQSVALVLHHEEGMLLQLFERGVVSDAVGATAERACGPRRGFIDQRCGVLNDSVASMCGSLSNLA